MSVRRFSGKQYVENNFGFQIVYSSNLPNTILPHRRALAMLELGRKTLSDLIPVGLLNPFPLQLESEKLGKSKKGCNCGPVYIQNWNVYNKVASEIIANPDPCFGEINATIPTPVDYISPINSQYYQAPNTGYNPLLPISNGNTQYIWNGTDWILNLNFNPLNFIPNPRWYYDAATGTWIEYPYFDSTRAETYDGNIPFTVKTFIKNFGLFVYDKPTDQLLWSDS
jgi:hypothetical protein